MNTLTLFCCGAAIALVVRTAPPSAYALDLSILFGGFAFMKIVVWTLAQHQVTR